MSAHGEADDIVEKGAAWSDDSSQSPKAANPTTSPAGSSKLRRLNARIEGLSGFEIRGIARVPPEERHKGSRAHDLQIFLLWLSANLSLNNLGVGMLGPLLFNLGFVDCIMCALVGSFVGALSTGYTATFGPASGNRTMVVARFFMGYWPSKVPCVLNIVLMVGYATIDAIIGGQVISAVSDGSVSIVVGIVIVTIIAWFIAAFGMALFQRYERYSWLPQVLALMVLVGCAGPKFDASSQSTVQGVALAAARLSFLSTCSYIPNSWTAAAADFYVYYPEKTSKTKIFWLTVAGLWTAFSLVFIIGAGLATGVNANPEWADANAVSSGALIVAGFEPLKGFGKLCSVIVALGVIANSTPSTYSAALGLQALGRYGQMVPRWVWSCVLVVIELVLGLAGREHLFQIYQNFTSLMGYWIELMVGIFLIEQYWFRRGKGEFDWARWDDKAYLPIGWAALAAFLIGWVGAILGMSQAWYVGPLSSICNGADVGMWIGFAFTLVSYPPLRYLELKKIGK